MKKRLIASLFVFFLVVTNTFSIAGAGGRVVAKGACVNQSVIQLKYPMQNYGLNMPGGQEA